MRYCRWLEEGRARVGRIEGEPGAGATVVELRDLPWRSLEETGHTRPFEGIELLVPTLATKIVCVGQNDRRHAAEMNKPVPAEPLIFLKPPSALNPHGAPIRLPPVSEDVQHESELGLVIGRRLSKVDEAEAAAGIFALTCINDVTARDVQRRETQHTRAKGYDTFACVGPWMVSGLDPADLRVRCLVNGEVRQEGRTSDLVFSPARLVSFMSHIMTLEPGDLISTGTPPGVGRLEAGDVVEVDIEGIGTLRNPVLESA